MMKVTIPVMKCSQFLCFLILLAKPDFGCGRSGRRKNQDNQLRDASLRRDLLSLEQQIEQLKATIATSIDDDLSPGNITAIRGETAMLVCTVKNIGNKSLSWLRHGGPIPQVMALNNITNTLDPRFRAIVAAGWSEFVLMVKDVQVKDKGLYECQVSGPQHTSLSKKIKLNVVEAVTEILGEADIYVDRLSTLNITCRVMAGSQTPAYIFWSYNDKILQFDGAETSVKSLEKDASGCTVSRLMIPDIELEATGEYVCQPANAPKASVQVHVLNTTVQAVLEEEELGDTIPLATLQDIPSSSSSTTPHKISLFSLLIFFSPLLLSFSPPLLFFSPLLLLFSSLLPSLSLQLLPFFLFAVFFYPYNLQSVLIFVIDSKISVNLPSLR